MPTQAKAVLDSLSPEGVRLTTLEVTLPRIVLAEFNTHRMFSRNSASSRAIPVEKQIKRVMEAPFVPTYWGANQPGMVAEQPLSPEQAEVARQAWLYARDAAVASAYNLLAAGVHKQLTNRLLEPFMYQTILVTATEWDNFYALRAHKAAQPEICLAAEMMLEAMRASVPSVVQYGGWHMPLLNVDEEDRDLLRGVPIEDLKKISAGRCARVSYLTHDGKRDPQADIDMCNNKIIEPGHMSPLEHVATPMQYGFNSFYGNFRGWGQYRKEIANEHNFGARQAAQDLGQEG